MLVTRKITLFPVCPPIRCVYLFRHSWPDICTAFRFPTHSIPASNLFHYEGITMNPPSFLSPHGAAACLWYSVPLNFAIRVNYIARRTLNPRLFFCKSIGGSCTMGGGYYSGEIKRELSACLSAWVSILESKCVSQSVALLHGIGNVCFKFHGVKIGTVAWYWKPIRVLFGWWCNGDANPSFTRLVHPIFFFPRWCTSALVWNMQFLWLFALSLQ